MRFEEFRFRKDPDCPVCGDAADRHRARSTTTASAASAPSGETAMREISAARAAALAAARRGASCCSTCASPQELADARGSRARMLVPLGELEARLAELRAGRSGRVVVHCHHGGAQRCAPCELLSAARLPRRREPRRAASTRGRSPSIPRCRATEGGPMAKPAIPIRSSAAIWSSATLEPRARARDRRGVPGGGPHLRRGRLPREGRRGERLARCAPTPSREGDLFLVREIARAARRGAGRRGVERARRRRGRRGQGALRGRGATSGGRLANRPGG